MSWRPPKPIELKPQSTVQQWQEFATKNREEKREKALASERLDKENAEADERIRKCVKKETDLRNPLKEKEITINLKRVTEDYFAEQERQKIKAKVERLKKTYGERVYKDAPLITGENKNGRITLDDIPITIAEIKRINKRESHWMYRDESFERTSRCTTPRCNRIMDGIVRYQDYDGDSMHTEVCQIHSKQKI